MDIVRTIDSEDEIQVEDETDTEENSKIHKICRTIFSDNFMFHGNFDNSPMECGPDKRLEMTMDDQKANLQSRLTSLDVKIAHARERQEMKEQATSDENEDEEDEEEGEDKDFFMQYSPATVNIAFTDMNLSRPLLKAITSIGFVTPTPIQAKTIPLALAGKDICACAATGTGKTAAFMLPILERLLYRPTHIRICRVLVILPTRELAIQVHSVGKELSKNTNIELCLVAGGLESKRQEAALRKNPDIIVATPGRLLDHLHNTPSFNLQTVEVLVLDEADRMLDEHFVDEMNEIIKLCPINRQTLLFSATMTDEIDELARLSLKQPVRLFLDSNTNVASNLYQEFIRIRPNRELDREAILAALCCRSFKDQCLVFLPTKKLVHRMRILFGLLGLKATELHGSLTQLQRLESLKKFKEGEANILLATDLASRGLDIEKVKTVLNFSMPPTLKQYIHRVGRTARAGRSGRSVSLVGDKGRKVLKEVVKVVKNPPKNRVLLPSVITKYKNKIESLEDEIMLILKQEKEEMEMEVAKMEINKAANMIKYEKEIHSRPARVWFQTKREKKRKNGIKKVTSGSDEKVKSSSRADKFTNQKRPRQTSKKSMPNISSKRRRHI